MKRTPILVACVGIAAVIVVAAVTVVTMRANDSSSPPAAVAKPNVVVIMTDDQTLEEMRVMDNTRTLIGGQGATFSHYYASFPNCCPSRATYYTGQYSHNTGVRDNVPPYGGSGLLKADQTVPVWLQQNGYYTAHFGKYLNGWGQDGNIKPPPGWSHWFGLIDPSTYHYFDYSISDDGKKRDFGHAEADYSTDVLGNELVKTIDTASKSGKPFYLSFTPLSPHVESPEKSKLEFNGYSWPFAVPAPRYAGLYKNEQLPKTSSWNESDVSSKPDFIRNMKRITVSVEKLATKSYQLELETLKATDEWVGKIIQSLKDNGVYDNTLVMFTSDNGLFHGEHRIPNGKLYLYEEDVHLPFLIEGPGIAKGVTVDQPVGNVDLAPTIVAATGAKAGLVMDGRSVLPLIGDKTLQVGRAMLLENTHGGKVETEGLHTDRFVYLESEDGTVELYDLASDPDEVSNLHGSPAYATVEADLAARLKIAHTCAGATCEGSDAGHNAIPPPVVAPVADPATISANTVPPSADRVSQTDINERTNEALDALTGLFDLNANEKVCTTRALRDHADLLDTGGQPILQNNRALINAIGVSKSCIAGTRLGTGLAAILPLITEGKLASNDAVCVGGAMAQLTDTQLAALLDFLLAPKDDPDIEAKAKTTDILRGCKVEPATIVN